MDLREIGWGTWSGIAWLRIRNFAGFCECGDEPSGSGVTELVVYKISSLDHVFLFQVFRLKCCIFCFSHAYYIPRPSHPPLMIIQLPFTEEQNL
jgi:hypothetical protein